MSVLLIAEHNNKEVRPFTLNAITAASQMDGDVHVLLIGNNCVDVAKLLSEMPKAPPMQQQEAVNKYLDDNPLVNYSNEENTLVSDDGFRFELIPK